MNEIDKMSGGQFEDYLSTLFNKIGFKVIQTKATGDFGADLLLQKDGNVITVQAKRYQKRVGVEAVQQVLGAKSYYRGNEAWVVTNNYFTEAAIALARSSRVYLIDRELLMTMVLNQDQKLDF